MGRHCSAECPLQFLQLTNELCFHTSLSRLAFLLQCHIYLKAFALTCFISRILSCGKRLYTKIYFAPFFHRIRWKMLCEVAYWTKGKSKSGLLPWLWFFFFSIWSSSNEYSLPVYAQADRLSVWARAGCFTFSDWFFSDMSSIFASDSKFDSLLGELGKKYAY